MTRQETSARWCWAIGAGNTEDKIEVNVARAGRMRLEIERAGREERAADLLAQLAVGRRAQVGACTGI